MGVCDEASAPVQLVISFARHVARAAVERRQVRAAAAGCGQLDAQPRFSGHRPQAVSRAVARDEQAMTARDEILSKVKKALGRRDAAHDVAQAVSLRSDVAPSPSSTHAPLSPQQITLACDQQREALIEQFEAALLRVGGHFSVAANAQMVCERVADIAAVVKAKKAVGWHSPWLQQLGLPKCFA